MKVLLSSEKIDINVKLINKGYTDKLFIKLEDNDNESKDDDNFEEDEFEDKIKIKIKDKFTFESKKKNKKSRVKNSKVFIKKTKDAYIYENIEKQEYKDHQYIDGDQRKVISTFIYFSYIVFYNHFLMKFIQKF